MYSAATKESQMTLPNFLIIGAAKSGTTALYHYLKQHPQVYMSPQKETNFFAFEGQKVCFHGPGDQETSDSIVTTLDSYKEQFRAVSNESAIGEASPWYLYSDHAATNIHRRIPDAKLIAVLRNPADRAFSSYLHVIRHRRENLSFEEGLLAEEERIAHGWEPIWHYQRVGFYAEQVKSFLDLFGREQTRFYLYDDFLKDPYGTLRDIYKFLDVDPGFVADTSVKPNVTGVPKNRLVGRLVFQPNALKAMARMFVPKQLRYELSQKLGQRLLVKPSPCPAIRAKLLRRFERDILDLQDLIERDLSAWTKRAGSA
jgi:hypothetical protein